MTQPAHGIRRTAASRFTPLRVAAGALALIGGVGMAGPSGAQPGDADLASMRQLSDWLAGSAKLSPESVVAIHAWGVAAITQRSPHPPSDIDVVVRVESFPDPRSNPDAAASTESEISINCLSHRAHTERIQSFSENGRSGRQSTSFGPSGWDRPAPGTTMDSVVLAACDPAFHPPLQRLADALAPAAVAQPAVQPSPSPSPAAALPAAPSASADPPAGEPAVQLFASFVPAPAEALSASTARALQAGWPRLRVAVEPSATDGRSVYRVVVRGFADTREADGFCKAMAAEGKACFLRR